MTITVSTNDPRSVKALALLETADRWTKAHRKADGRSFFVIPGSQGRVYWTDQSSCTCPDAGHRGATCKHQLAVRLWNLRQHAGATRPQLTEQDLREVLGPPPGSSERRLDPARVAALSAEYTALFPADE